MGLLRSKVNRRGVIVDGVELGIAPIALIDGSQPTGGEAIDDMWFVWSHQSFPNGVVRADGTVIEDEVEP